MPLNAISCSYFGGGHFQVNWHGEFRTRNDHHYEVRYSTSPITNANYASATLAPGCSDLTKAPGSYSWVKADFTIPVENGQIYYFAIKDLSSDNPYVTRIDYPVGDIPHGNHAPLISPQGFTATPSSLNNPGESTTFNVSATDPDGDPLTYTINFGDGTANGSGSQVVHTYENKGTYTATVTVDDGHGHTVAESIQVIVNNIPPVKPTGVSAN